MNERIQLPVLTASSGRCYRRCPREYQYHYEQGYSSAERASTLRFGTAIHAGLEVLFSNGWDIDAALSAALNSADNSDPFEAAKIEVMLRGYALRWEADASRLRTVSVESEFRSVLVNPETGFPSKTWELAGKLDGIVEDEQGKIWVIEHKTSSEDVSIGSQYWEKLRMDSQVSTYYVGARALGFDPEGVIYDVLRKPLIRPSKATPNDVRKYKKDGSLYANQREFDETPDEFRSRLIAAYSEEPEAYFSRGEVVRLEAEEKEAALDVWQQGKFIRESQLENRWPRNPEACERYHRLCEFWPVCTKTADITDESRFTIEKIHQELETA